MRLGYLYSRYPVISQTFCDREMLALEQLGFSLTIGSVHPPHTSLRHEHIAQLRAPIYYAPHQKILSIRQEKEKAGTKWPADLVDRHTKKYGAGVKAEIRARNALYFADLFMRNGVEHVHIHFANRAAHSAIFLKEISGIPFSVTAHGQDFMSDLGSDELLGEICDAAEFVAAETEYSAELLRQRCPRSKSKIIRVYNGIDLKSLPAPVPELAGEPVRILSVGRLVPFKGFEHLIEACAELVRRGLQFRCEIVGDGPLHESLQRKIESCELSARVFLLGSLSQAAVFDKLRSANIFALPSIIDEKGASDIFPTVIAEAMSAGRAVVSTRLAGIPELVANEESGLLVEPGNIEALTNALERLIQDPKRRMDYGRAGRKRIDEHFQIGKTVLPLVQQFQQRKTRGSSVVPGRLEPDHSIAYIIDHWPAKGLPDIEEEIQEMQQRDVPIVPIICEFDSNTRLSPAMEEFAGNLEFLPDPIVIEAEWRASRTLAQELEEQRANEKERPPSGIFLRQARFALALRKLIAERKISHVHATSSPSLVCALILHKLANVTISATIERKSELSPNWLQNALKQCSGGRVQDKKLFDEMHGFVLLDKASGFRLTGRGAFWQEWAESLKRWSQRTANKQ